MTNIIPSKAILINAVVGDFFFMRPGISRFLVIMAVSIIRNIAFRLNICRNKYFRIAEPVAIGVKPLGNNNCLAGLDTGCQPWHPMKGPMTTLTLQDIIAKEPHHLLECDAGADGKRPGLYGA